MIGYYKLPALLTYMNVIAAVAGMYFAMTGRFGVAMACLVIAGICDMFDGAVARKCERTAREKSYGIEMDALADIVSFGVFPTVIGYAMGLNRGWYAAIGALFILAALTRLAYFNATELEKQSGGDCVPRKYYEGLPVTSVAIHLPLIYIIVRLFGWDAQLPRIYAIALVLTAVAFVVRLKIPKLRGKCLLVCAALSIPLVAALFILG